MKLFVFGIGYTAGFFVRHHGAASASVAGTVRTADGAARLAADGIDAIVFDSADPAGLPRSVEDVLARLLDVDAILVSVQPGAGPDPVLAHFGPAIAAAPNLRRIVYLSTIGVYGDHGGAWIDESAGTEASNGRQAARVVSEGEWLALGKRNDKAVTVLRLAGIYGPGRNALVDLQRGEARRIDKPGQVFNRIHVADIGQAIAASLASDSVPPVVNVTDDEPAPAPDVVAYAASLLGLVAPPLLPFAEAQLSPMARSFYGANRRVKNEVLRRELGVALRYPTFRSGLDALWSDGEGRS